MGLKNLSGPKDPALQPKEGLIVALVLVLMRKYKVSWYLRRILNLMPRILFSHGIEQEANILLRTKSSNSNFSVKN